MEISDAQSNLDNETCRARPPSSRFSSVMHALHLGTLGSRGMLCGDRQALAEVRLTDRTAKPTLTDSSRCEYATNSEPCRAVRGRRHTCIPQAAIRQSNRTERLR
jgi:hypothetical protein